MSIGRRPHIHPRTKPSVRCFPITVWRVFEFDGRRHLVGRRMDTGIGHVSSGLERLETDGSGYSRSLAVYQLFGPPDSDKVTDDVWAMWQEKHNARTARDISALLFAEMLDSGYKPGTSRLNGLGLQSQITAIPPDFPLPAGTSSAPEALKATKSDVDGVWRCMVDGEDLLATVRALDELARGFCERQRADPPRLRPERLRQLKAQFWSWSGTPYFLTVDQAKWTIRKACAQLRWRIPKPYLPEGAVPECGDIDRLVATLIPEVGRPTEGGR